MAATEPVLAAVSGEREGKRSLEGLAQLPLLSEKLNYWQEKCHTKNCKQNAKWKKKNIKCHDNNTQIRIVPSSSFVLSLICFNNL